MKYGQIKRVKPQSNSDSIMIMRKFIPVSEPQITDLEKFNVNKVLDSGWISSTGEFVDKFEKMESEILRIIGHSPEVSFNSSLNLQNKKTAFST